MAIPITKSWEPVAAGWRSNGKCDALRRISDPQRSVVVPLLSRDQAEHWFSRAQDAADAKRCWNCSRSFDADSSTDWVFHAPFGDGRTHAFSCCPATAERYEQTYARHLAPPRAD